MIHLRRPSRREFVRAAAGAPLLMSACAPKENGGTPPPTDKLNIAYIGIGGLYGPRAIEELRDSHNVAALCDIDWRTKDQFGELANMVTPAVDVIAQYPDAPHYDDWRQMLEEKGDGIDAVVICSADHAHAVAAITAMKAGKHVFCEKPLAHSVDEVQAMMAAAHTYGVATQTGVQGHASEDLISMVEWIQDGAIGDVKEVHCFEGAGPKGADRRQRPSVYDNIAHVNDQVPVPPEVKWDLFLGPAPERPYNPMYTPLWWRNWLDFGTGILGDHGPHYIDVPFWALDLGLPETIQAETDPEYDPKTNTQTWPTMWIVHFTFPARGDKPPVALTWHANHTPPLPSYVKEDQLPAGGGMIVGSKGAIVYANIYAGKPGETVEGMVQLLPEELDKSYTRPAKTIPRPKSHWLEWTECIKSGKKPSTNFDYGGPLTNICLLGDIAVRNKGTLLRYDAASGKFTNSDAANEAMGHYSRPGWELPT